MKNINPWLSYGDSMGFHEVPRFWIYGTILFVPTFVPKRRFRELQLKENP